MPGMPSDARDKEFPALSVQSMGSLRDVSERRLGSQGGAAIEELGAVHVVGTQAHGHRAGMELAS
eukprot:11854733-Alexandrium_andersonii.AAC.1